MAYCLNFIYFSMQFFFKTINVPVLNRSVATISTQLEVENIFTRPCQ